MVWFYKTVICLKDTEGMANRVAADQTDLGLTCLLRLMYLELLHYMHCRRVVL